MSKIQEYVDMIDTNILNSMHGLTDIKDPDLWCIARWLILEMAEQGLCNDNHESIMKIATAKAAEPTPTELHTNWPSEGDFKPSEGGR